MSLTPEALLVGPRGRRLCLEFALASDQSLRLPVMVAANHLSPRSGTSALVTFGTGTHEQPAAIPATPGDVASAITAATLRPMEAGMLLAAFAEAVDAARYWQEPDGEDVLAEQPALRDPLLGVAAHVLASAGVMWWEQGVAPEQWAVEWDRPDRTAVVSNADARGRLRQWRDKTRAAELVARRDRPTDSSARVTGEWWSTPPSSLVRTTRDVDGIGPVGVHLVEDSLGWERAAVIRMHGAGRVYEIDTPESWVALCARYPLDVTASRRHDWYRITGRAGEWVIPDWMAVAEDWDAVHLTAAAYLQTAGRSLEVTDGVATVLAGWGPDATIWLADTVRPGGSPREWTRTNYVWHAVS